MVLSPRMENPTQRNPEIDERVRLLGVYRLWTQALGQPWRLSSLHFRDLAAGLTIITAVLLMPLDAALWSLRGPLFPWSQLPLPRSGVLAAGAFLGSYAINTFLLHRTLAWSTREPGIYRPWIVALRFLLCGIPLAGLYVVPAWKWIQRVRPAWAIQGRPGSTEAVVLKESHQLWSVPGSALLGGSKRFIWLLLFGSFAPLVLCALWISKFAEHRLLLGISLTLHTIQFLIVALDLRLSDVPRSISKRRMMLLSTLTVAWLIPFPFLPILGWLPVMLLDPRTAQSSTLLWQVLVRRQGAGRLPLWLDLEDALRTGWNALPFRKRLRKPPRSMGVPETVRRSEHQILKLYDFISFSLIFDAATLSWALSGIFPLQRLLGGMVIACLVLSAVGTCVAVFHIALMLLRVPGKLRILDRHPCASYLARTQLYAAAGLWLGSAIRQGLETEAGLLLMLSIPLLILIEAFSSLRETFFPRPPVRNTFREEIHKLGSLYLLMLVFGLGGPLGLLPRLFLIWMVLLPLRALWMARTLLPWLLRPFEIRDLFARRGLPPHLRLGLGVLATSALLPLGGWLVPLCIGVRHRLWAEAEAVEWKERTA